MINIRPYTALDLQACLRLFDGNVPKFFDPSERKAFATFLQDLSLRTAFLAIENDGVIIACGGHVMEDEGQTAGLCWGMVDQSMHGQGLGRLLTDARLQAIRKQPSVQRVRLDTSQHTHAFYSRFGFSVEKVEKDGYGPGLDRHDMVLLL
ncbi:putative GNAT family N-acyltransferase [Rhizobium sp. BIGb0125]|uniref:GNAT family N-acetyltransferase n=1 Tax=Rhizobium sp. BIGb0125 TaxID=2940618 RepID=UPI002168C68B|nr:GNAT family N-acetyltransferase [Rhizobium sp. BIGb0125]MCS4243544.1 putative GNAT family N-acyltransferase [Rhizobium sp. BIGb0125]